MDRLTDGRGTISCPDYLRPFGRGPSSRSESSVHRGKAYLNTPVPGFFRRIGATSLADLAYCICPLILFAPDRQAVGSNYEVADRRYDRVRTLMSLNLHAYDS